MLKKYFSETALIASIALFTFVSRIINLLKIPIFTDEAIYIRWAQIGLADPAHRFISLTDGKQPLLTWFMYLPLRFFSDPLFAGRMVSVVSAVFAVIGIYFLAKVLYGKKTAVIACLFYIFSPFTLVYNRLALMDSWLTTFGIWSLFLQVLQVRFLRLDLALILGMVMGLGMLTKSSALFFIILFPLGLLIFDFSKKEIIIRLSKWVFLSVASAFFSEIYFNILRLSPWFYIIEQKNLVFIKTLGEVIKDPFMNLLPNLNGLLGMTFSYMTLPVTILIVAGLIFGFLRKDKKTVFLFLWFFLPFISLSIFAKILFPRFVLFMIPPLFIISAEFLRSSLFYSSNKIKAFSILALIMTGYTIFQSGVLVFSPIQANIPKIDRNQLFDDWPSGYGVNEVISYLSKRAQSRKIVIGTEGTFGLNPAVYEIYLQTNPNVEIFGFWPVSSVPELLLEKAKNTETYLVFKETQKIPESWPLILIAKYKRGKGETYLYFFKVGQAKI